MATLTQPVGLSIAPLFPSFLFAHLSLSTDPIGKVSTKNLDLIATARECLDESIRQCVPGFEYRNFGAGIEEIAVKKGFSTNKKYCGHGINQCVFLFLYLSVQSGVDDVSPSSRTDSSTACPTSLITPETRPLVVSKSDKSSPSSL
jgi:hypothetical protein